jgi:tRNA (cmo5U34)-methyltransferase
MPSCTLAPMVRFLHAPDRYLQLMREGIARYDRLQDEVVAAIEGVPAARILDLGVGTGETTRRCLQAHPSATVVAIDASEDMLAIAAGVLDERTALRHARLQDPLPPGPFDLVVSALAVHHLDGPGKADLFARVRERLAPGGRFVMADVIVPDAPVAEPTPLVEPVDMPDRLDDQLAWMRAAGLEPAVRWAEQDLVVVACDIRGGGGG